MARPMQFDIITLFPDMFSALNHGITGRAMDQSLIECTYFNPRDYTHDAHRTVDDRPYGGGPGMVMKYEPLAGAIADAKRRTDTPAKVIYLSPAGKPLTQQAITELRTQPRLILLSGRYEGIDHRLIETHVDEEWSIGDYVLSGGELPAMVLIDAITRQLDGALGHPQSAAQDSFFNGLLDHPHYTRPEKIAEKSVPNVLLSGDHQRISQYRLKQALGKTWQNRPDLIKRRILNEEEQALLEAYIKEAES